MRLSDKEMHILRLLVYHPQFRIDKFGDKYISHYGNLEGLVSSEYITGSIKKLLKLGLVQQGIEEIGFKNSSIFPTDKVFAAKWQAGIKFNELINESISMSSSPLGTGAQET